MWRKEGYFASTLVRAVNIFIQMDHALIVAQHLLFPEVKMALDFAIIPVLSITSYIGMELVWMSVNIHCPRELQMVTFIAIFHALLERIFFIGMVPAHLNALIRLVK